METQIFSISGVTCNNCVTKIEGTKPPGSLFKRVSVERDPDRIVVSASSPVSADQINDWLLSNQLGKYKAIEFDGNKKTSDRPQSLFKQLFPLTLVISYILIAVITVAWTTANFSMKTMMFHYMAGFFLVFSFFKFLNIQGFADAFQTYDPIAKSWRPYGYIYASFELLAGIGYLVAPQSILLNGAVLLLLGISSIGVIQAVRAKGRIQCACLGTVFNLPMTKVTVVENVSMMAMAGMALF